VLQGVERRRRELATTTQGRPVACTCESAGVATDPLAVRVEEAGAVSDDLVAAVAALVGQLSASASPPTPDQLRAIVASPASRLLLARGADGRIIGMLTLVLFPIPTGVRAWIEDVVVDAGARGQGVGALLTAEALRLARADGARTVDLTSRPGREAANRLYAKLGFERRDTNVYRYDQPPTGGTGGPAE
jgi:ribosomal protein S18 acetylase RimI-like enzyme